MVPRFLLAGGIAIVFASSDAPAEDGPMPAAVSDSAAAPPPPALPAPAPAAPAPPAAAPSASPPSTEDDRLRRFLEVEASAGRRGRVSGAVVNAVMGAVVVPPGVILAMKDDPGLQIAGVTLLIRGGWDLLSVPFALATPTPMENLLRHHEERTARGEAAVDRIAETEREWQHAIEEQRSASVPNAILALSLGSLEVAAGMYLLLQEPILGFDRREQTVWGTLILGASLPGLAGGLFSLFGESPMEEQWELYQTGKPASSLGRSTAIKVVPIRSGVAGAFELAF